MDATKIINPGSISELLLQPDLRNKLNKGGDAKTGSVYNSNYITEVPLCIAATTGNIALDGSVTTVDGVTLVAGQLVLAWQQTDTTTNAVYIVNLTGNWLRFDPHQAGMVVSVRDGGTYAEHLFMLISEDVTLGQVMTFVDITEGGGLEFFEELRNTTTPNATKPAHILKPLGTETNIDFAIIPKGNGAILNVTPDNTTTGGNKRGQYAIDLQFIRYVNDNVASGDYAVIIGGAGNKASSSQSIVIGGVLNSAGYRTAIISSGYSITDNTGDGYNIILGGYTNRIRSSAEGAGIIAGKESESNGGYTLAQGSNNIANDFCEAIFGHFATQNSGNRFTPQANNSVFKVGCGASTSNRLDAIKVLGDGRIFAETLKAPSTKKELIISDDTGLIQNLGEGTTGQVLVQKALEPVWENLSIPENRSSYLITQDLFPNLFVTTDPAPLPPPITTFRKVGDITDTGVTDFKVTLKANKRYAIKLRLYLDLNDVIGFNSYFELKLNAPGTWASSLYLMPQTKFEIKYRPEITTYDAEGSSAIAVTLNTNISLDYENDSGTLVRNIPFVDIEGIITTDTADELSISMRNSVLALADGDNTMVVKQNSFITAVETTAN